MQSIWKPLLRRRGTGPASAWCPAGPPLPARSSGCSLVARTGFRFTGFRMSGRVGEHKQLHRYRPGRALGRIGHPLQEQRHEDRCQVPGQLVQFLDRQVEDVGAVIGGVPPALRVARLRIQPCPVTLDLLLPDHAVQGIPGDLGLRVLGG